MTTLSMGNYVLTTAIIAPALYDSRRETLKQPQPYLKPKGPPPKGPLPKGPLPKGPQPKGPLRP